MITKNEPLLEQCLQSVRDYVEEIVIVDTGSSDNTPEIAKKYADIYKLYTDCNDPNTGLIDDFSLARNYSLSLATKTKVMWCDADDVIEGMSNLSTILRDCDEMLASNSNSDCYSVMFPYEYGYDPNGKCICRHYRERIFSNKNCFHFVNPVHEVAVVNDGLRLHLISDDSILYKHRRQFSTKSVDPGRNLRILKKYVEGAGANDARQMYYIGLEYYNNGFVLEAIGSLVKYIELSGWDDEKVMACLKLVDIYQGLSQYQEGLKWAFKAIEINETWAEGYLAVGKMFYFIASNSSENQLRNWQRCVHFIRTGLSMPPTKTLLFVNPMERDFEIHKYLNVALNACGDVQGALESANAGLKVQSDGMLLGNKKLYENFLALNQLNNSVDVLKNNNKIDGETSETIKSLANNILDINRLFGRKIDISVSTLNIVFFAGDGLENWTPDTIKTNGIGGSELMLAELAKRLSVMGHSVRVYNSCNNMEGTYEGVNYLLTHKFNNIDCDILIVSRNAMMLSDIFNIRSKIKLLWVHDIWAINATPELLAKADKILALSQWHKDNLINAHGLSPDKILITRNGVDLKRFNKEIKRNKFKCVVSSSPDRYLPALLNYWPEIKELVPDAELHIFYGFFNWTKVASNEQLQLINFLKQKMLDMAHLNVIFRDRINQQDLAIEFLSAGALLYPTFFQETFFIGGAEAQAAGLRIITSDIAAIRETVGERGTLIGGDWLSDEYRKQFVSSTVKALTDANDSDRLLIQEYAKKHFCLDELAKEWNSMFIDLLNKSDTKEILIPYNQFEMGQ